MPHPIIDAPVIGISGASADSKSVQAMAHCVQKTGATPIILANHAQHNAQHDIDKFDAIIVMGNDYDVDPELYRHRYREGDPRQQIHPKTRSARQTEASNARAEYEWELIERALPIQMPLFSICGGMQTLNVLCGGTLHQHIPDFLGHDQHAKNAGEEATRAVISVSIVPGTLLDRIIKNPDMQAQSVPQLIGKNGVVNAFHHQAVDQLGTHLIASAHSDSYIAIDGSQQRLIEAIEADPTGPYKDQFLLGVQWHPEFLPEATDVIVRDMQEAARAFAQSQNRTHPPQQAKMENILSAVPILKNFSEIARTPHTLPHTDKPKGRGR